MAQATQQFAPLRYAAPGMGFAVFGMLFSALSGTYVGWHSPGDVTLLVMQSFLVYSIPYLLLGVVGFAAFHINRLKTMAVVYALCTALLTASTVCIVSRAADLIKRLDDANGRAVIVGLVIAVVLSGALPYAAKHVKPRDDLPF